MVWTLYNKIEIDPTLAASIVGVFIGLTFQQVTRNYEDKEAMNQAKAECSLLMYSASFAGMSTTKAIANIYACMLCPLIVIIYFRIFKKSFLGFGGKAGSIAFLSVLTSSFLFTFYSYFLEDIGKQQVEYFDGTCYTAHNYLYAISIISAGLGGVVAFFMTNDFIIKEKVPDPESSIPTVQDTAASERTMCQRIVLFVKQCIIDFFTPFKFILITQKLSPISASSIIALTTTVILLSVNILYDRNFTSDLNYNYLLLSIYAGTFAAMTDKKHFIEIPMDPNRLYYVTLCCMHFLSGCISGLILFILCGFFPGDVGGKAGLSSFITVAALVYSRRFVRFVKALVKRKQNPITVSSTNFDIVVLSS